MVDRILKVDVLAVGDAHADKATASRGIHQRLLLVRGADERCIAAELLDGLAVGRTELHFCRRQQVLQYDLLRIRCLVELVDVDQRKHRQRDIQVELVLEVDFVVIVVSQLWRQNDLAEARLSTTLTAYQQGNQRITRQLTVALTPLGHHSHEPHPQIFLPMGLIRRYPLREVLDIVMTVPLRQFVEPGVHGVVLLDASGVDETVHVPVPRLHS